MKTEYLIPLDTSNGIASTCSSFNNLLMSNSNISISSQEIRFKNSIFNYKLQANPIPNTTTICYHMTIEFNTSTTNLEEPSIQTYRELLRNIRAILSKHTNNLEILWDDISYLCSQKAYPQIYEIENLMRKLLTKFMLINVGAKWEHENIPSKINKSKNKDKNINVGNSLLYQLDFIELSNFLFEPYPLKNDLHELKKLIDSNSTISNDLLEQYIPKSNWERYFSDIVVVENNHFMKQWEALYSLRCKIAHNNQFTVTNLNKVTAIVNDLKPSIEKAIHQLDKIKIENTSKEIISENFAKTQNDQTADFLIVYNNLHNIMLDLILPANLKPFTNRPYSFQKTISLLRDKEFINDAQYKSLTALSYRRNALVHQQYKLHSLEIALMANEAEEFVIYFQNLKGNNHNETN